MGLTDGYAAAFLGAAGIALAGAVVAGLALRLPRGEADAAETTEQPRIPAAA